MTIFSSEMTYTPSQIVGTWLRNWKVLALCIWVPTIAAFLLCFFARKTYTAEQTLIISKSTSKSASSLLSAAGIGDVASLIGLGGGSEMSQMKILSQSGDLALAAIGKFRLDTVWYPEQEKKPRHEDLLKSWQTQFDYSASDEEGVHVLWRDHNPERSVAVVRYVSFWLDSTFQALQRASANANLSFIDKRLQERKLLVGRLEDSIANFLKRNKTFSPDIQIAQSTKKYAQLDAEAEKINFELQATEQSQGAASSRWKLLSQSKRDLEKRMEEINDGTPNPYTRRLEGNIPRNVELKLQFERLTREMERHAVVYKYLVQQQEVLAFDAHKSVPLLFVVDSVRVPEKKSAPKTMIITQLVFGMSVILSCAGVLFWGHLLSFWTATLLFARAKRLTD